MPNERTHSVLRTRQFLGELAGAKVSGIPEEISVEAILRRHRVPVVLSREEVKAVLEQMTGVTRLMAELMYGAGLRVCECVTLRVKDIDFSSGALNILDCKGGTYRTTLLPMLLHVPLNQHLLRMAESHKQDLSQGAGLAPMPSALARKYSSSSSSFGWQFVFPSTVLRPWGEGGRLARWHISDSTIQRAFRDAKNGAGIHKHVSVHALRLSHLLASGTDIV